MNEVIKISDNLIQFVQRDINGQNPTVVVSDNSADEYCPKCENIAELHNVFVPQICEHCFNILLPCSICNHQKCGLCPLEKVRNVMKDSMELRGTSEEGK